MEYRCISADCHIDLCWLPHDLFVSNASAALKDRMPFVENAPDGPRWRTRAGTKLGFANGKGNPGSTGTGNWTYVAGREHRIDRMASTGLFNDAIKGVFRPTTPELRIQDQDQDGIQAEVMYGLHGTGSKMTDKEATVELYRIYNDWLADFCSYDRRRLIGLASIPCHTIDAAVAETIRVAKMGLGGIDFLASWNMIPLWNPYWDPLWQTAAEVNLPVHFHTIGQPPVDPVPADLPSVFNTILIASLNGGKTVNIANILGALVYGKALERYPKLRIVLGESGIGWLPYVLERMDYEYNGRFKEIGLEMKPSDYWRRQCRATFQKDETGTKLLDDIGIDTVMWASDYPHPDGLFPDSQDYIGHQFGHLPAAAQRKITCENAGRFYGLM